MINTLKLLEREISLSFKNSKSLLSYVSFFFISLILFIFAIGPDVEILSLLFRPILWVIMIFALISISETFVYEDYLDGSLQELQFLGYSEISIFLSKCFAMTISLLIPNLVLIPISSIFFNIENFFLIETIFFIILAFPTLSLISILSALISLQVKKNKFIQFILIMPFFIPIVIFSTGTNFLLNIGNEFKILILISLFLITLPLCIFLGRLVIKEINH